jgi:branched-chain amino acid transport system substrate-binding protein
MILLNKLLLSSLLPLSFTLSAGAEEQLIKIGAILNLTGDLAMQEAAFQEGLELGISELNNPTPRYSLILEDAKNNARESYTKATELVTSYNVPVIILSSATDALTDGPMLERKKVPSLVLWDSNPDMDKIGEYLFGIGPWTPSAAEASAKFIRNNLKFKRVVLVYNREPWSEKIANYFKQFFPTIGGEVIAEFPLNPDETEFRSIATKIKSLNPDVIYTPVSYNIVPFYTQIRNLHLTQPIVSSDIIADEHIHQAPAAFDGIYQSNILDPSSEQFREMAKKYEAHFHKPVTLAWFVAVAYDAVKILDQVISKVGPDPVKIKEAMYGVKDYHGASTTISINPQGSSPQFEVMYQVQGGRFKLVS